MPLTSEFVPAPAALSDGDPKLVALVREAEDSEVAAGRGRKGKRAEYYCAACGYGIVVYGQPPSCPMCSEARWEHVEWRPFSQPLNAQQSNAPSATPADVAFCSGSGV